MYLVSIQPLVCKFLEGMNCTIFAYGQTGSGKTYTIGSGYYMGEEKDGMITRTLLDIFKVGMSVTNGTKGADAAYQ